MFEYLIGKNFHSIVLSDIHLGAENSLVEPLAELLKLIRDGQIKISQLIINGDLVDNPSGKITKKSHWKILRILSQISEKMRLVVIFGNHDNEDIPHLIGAEVTSEFIESINDIKYLFVHGDRFDKYITDHPILTACADWIYGIVQKLDKSHNFARFLKRSSKQFIRNSTRIKKLSCEYALSKDIHFVCVGHSHHAEIDNHPLDSDKIKFLNSGCFTENPPSIISIDLNGVPVLHYANIS